MVGAVNRTACEKLNEIQKGGKDPDFEMIFDDLQKDEVDRMGAEIYSTLSNLVTGEAMVVIRGVAQGDGWTVWSKLFNRFDPKTPAKALMAMMAVMNPKKVKNIR